MKKSLLAAVALAALASTQAQAATYALDPTHTFVTFEIPHFATSTNRGRFDRKEGTVEFDAAAKTGKVNITVDINSINTGTPKFDSHLKSNEILDGAKYPTAKFVSDKFVFNGDKVSEITGQLTLLDKTLPATLKATNFNCFNHPMLKREVCGGDFRATIKRSDWGVKYGLDYGFSDNVDLVIQVEAIKQ